MDEAKGARFVTELNQLIFDTAAAIAHRIQERGKGLTLESVDPVIDKICEAFPHTTNLRKALQAEVEKMRSAVAEARNCPGITSLDKPGRFIYKGHDEVSWRKNDETDSWRWNYHNLFRIHMTDEHGKGVCLSIDPYIHCWRRYDGDHTYLRPVIVDYTDASGKTSSEEFDKQYIDGKWATRGIKGFEMSYKEDSANDSAHGVKNVLGSVISRIKWPLPENKNTKSFTTNFGTVLLSDENSVEQALEDYFRQVANGVQSIEAKQRNARYELLGALG